MANKIMTTLSIGGNKYEIYDKYARDSLEQMASDIINIRENSISFIVVTALPDIGYPNSIYLLYNPTGEGNNYDEYIYMGSDWEKIGSVDIEANLDDYVKKTDYASYGKHGIFRYNDNSGVYIAEGGVLYLDVAKPSDIDTRSPYRAISSINLDYAIKVGLTTNTLSWSEEEKQATRELLGLTVYQGEVEEV